MSLAELSDVELVHGVVVGDGAAADEFVRRFTNLVWSILLSHMHFDRETASEVHQEVWVHLMHDNYRRLRNWSGTGDLAPYLCTIVRNLARDRLHGERRNAHEELPMGDARIEARGLDPQEEAWIQQQRELVRRALLSLGDSDRKLYGLAVGRGLTRPEIAAALGITPNAVGVRLNRMLRRLRQEVKEAIERQSRAAGRGGAVRSDGLGPSSG